MNPEKFKQVYATSLVRHVTRESGMLTVSILGHSEDINRLLPDLHTRTAHVARADMHLCAMFGYIVLLFAFHHLYNCMDQPTCTKRGTRP